MKFYEFIGFIFDEAHVSGIKKSHGYISSVKLYSNFPTGETIGPHRSLAELKDFVSACYDLSDFYKLLSDSDITNI